MFLICNLKQNLADLILTNITVLAHNLSKLTADTVSLIITVSLRDIAGRSVNSYTVSNMLMNNTKNWRKIL